MSHAVQGFVQPRFEAVRTAFAESLVSGEELGARFSVRIGGEVVVDLWGGHADRACTQPFTDRHIAPVYSTTKAVTALMIARLVDQGKLDYEQTVASIWPEFGAAGKSDITIGQLLSHQAGLPGFVPPQSPEIWFDPKAVCDTLAAQAPMWEPGTGSGYHPVSGGYLIGEVFRRVDGRTVGTALREDISGPLGIDFQIGTPESEDHRVAEMQKPTAAVDLGTIDPIKRAAFLDKGSAPAGRGSAEWRRMEIPSANGHGTALALAQLMGIVATGGWCGETRVLSLSTIAQATRERVVGQDKVLPFRLSWGAGFLRNTGLEAYGPHPRAVGHSGWGGSCAFADPDKALSAAYVMTRQSIHLLRDPRPLRLIAALYSAL